jgi:uncharacterized caspase-like protein
MARSLRDVNFSTVILKTDVSRGAFLQSLHSYREQSAEVDWAVIYYSGLNIDRKGRNFLVPIDAKLAADRDIEREAVPLDSILDALSGAKKLKLLILDSSKENPFAATIFRDSEHQLGKLAYLGIVAIDVDDAP